MDLVIFWPGCTRPITKEWRRRPEYKKLSPHERRNYTFWRVKVGAGGTVQRTSHWD